MCVVWWCMRAWVRSRLVVLNYKLVIREEDNITEV